MSRRGWAATDPARESGVSRPTISAALGVRRLTLGPWGLVARALARVPAETQIDSLTFGKVERLE